MKTTLNTVLAVLVALSLSACSESEAKSEKSLKASTEVQEVKEKVERKGFLADQAKKIKRTGGVFSTDRSSFKSSKEKG